MMRKQLGNTIMMKIPEQQGESRSGIGNQYMMKKVNNSHQELPRIENQLEYSVP